MKKLKKLFIISIIFILTVMTVFYYKMSNYYHPPLFYIVQDDLEKFDTVKDRIFSDWKIKNNLKSLEISELERDDKIYTLVESFPSEKFDDVSDKIITFEYFSGGNWDNAADSYGIVYSPDELSLKKGLKHSWWNTIEYHYIPISEHWYLVRRSYTDLIHEMLFGDM